MVEQFENRLGKQIVLLHCSLSQTLHFPFFFKLIIYNTEGLALTRILGCSKQRTV
jgi:hypothetical protein